MTESALGKRSLSDHECLISLQQFKMMQEVSAVQGGGAVRATGAGHTGDYGEQSG